MYFCKWNLLSDSSNGGFDPWHPEDVPTKEEFLAAENGTSPVKDEDASDYSEGDLNELEEAKTTRL